jgi:hypothetical protein
MTAARAEKVLAACLVAAALASGVTAQSPPWGSEPFPDVLRLASLPLDMATAAAPARGEWALENTIGYFNVWQLSWHTGTVHKGLGLTGRPLTHGEIALLEQAFPRDQFFHLDTEGYRDDLRATVGIGHGLAVTLDVPFVGIGTPHWDGLAEDFHRTLGITQSRRDYFPRGRSTVVVRGRDGIVESLDGTQGSGLGDVSLGLSGPVGRWLGAGQRVAVVVEAPTGRTGTLWGSGGWDLGLRWYSTWRVGRGEVRTGLGYTHLDPAGSWLGVRRNDTWHAVLEARGPLARALDWRLQVRTDRSPLESFTSSDIGRPSFYWIAGVLSPLGRDGWVAFDLGQNYPGTAEAPDFSFHLLVGVRLTSARQTTRRART